MTTLKVMVRKPRIDGLYSVYIRIVHNRKPGYIKTDKIVDKNHITSNGELIDPVVNEYCSMLIRQYTDRLNRINTSLWDVKEVIDYLLKQQKKFVSVNMPEPLLVAWKKKALKEMQEIINLP